MRMVQEERGRTMKSMDSHFSAAILFYLFMEVLFFLFK